MERLDDFMLLHIMDYMKPKTACIFGSASKQLREVMKSHRMWYRLYVANRMKPVEYSHRDNCKGQDCWHNHNWKPKHRCSQCTNRIFSVDIKPGTIHHKYKKHADSLISDQEAFRLSEEFTNTKLPYERHCNHMRCYCFGGMSYCGNESHWKPSRYSTFRFQDNRDYHKAFLLDIYDLMAWTYNPGKAVNNAEAEIRRLEQDLVYYKKKLIKLSLKKRKATNYMLLSDVLKGRKKPRKLESVRPLSNIKGRQYFLDCIESESEEEEEEESSTHFGLSKEGILQTSVQARVEALEALPFVNVHPGHLYDPNGNGALVWGHEPMEGVD